MSIVQSSSVLPSPAADFAALNSQLGTAWGVTSGEPLAQYLAWADESGMFTLLHDCGRAPLTELRCGSLSKAGAEALIYIAASTNIVQRDLEGLYSLTDLGRTYFVNDSPYYVGAALYEHSVKPIPMAFLRASWEVTSPAKWSMPTRLRMQHSRNFGPSVVAARTGAFERVTHLIDMGGGSGVLAIPLALDYPTMQISLVELSEALPHIQDILARYGVEKRVHLIGLNMVSDDWRLPPFDGIYFGNIFHGFDDDGCRVLARKSYDLLPRGGRIWLHEVLFLEDHSGPLIAALWHANMVARKAGACQRTRSQLMSILESVGFRNCTAIPTLGGFYLLGACKD